ncbi:Structural maintenance of chromosomes protein 6 [Sorochytrium milnesiophthora]
MPAAKRKSSETTDRQDSTVARELTPLSAAEQSRQLRKRIKQEDSAGELSDDDDVIITRDSSSVAADAPVLVKTHPGNAATQLAQRERQSNYGLKAERGIIEKITLIHFLTHEHLEMVLGPKVNFLNGANGSGKSAVLAAIIVALGGKANNTGRGRSIKELIMDNKQYCLIKLQLANRGTDAFSPAVYGDSIIIERRMNRVGAGSYTLRAANGTKVSEKKRDLDTILDHFNIQVDNYLTWLTQDAAKEFLMNISPTDLYNFFAKGTELTRTEEVYDQIAAKNAEHLERMKKIKDSLGSLKKKRDDAKQMVHDMDEAAQLETIIDDLQKQRMWADIVEHERAIAAQMQKLASNEARVAQVEERLAQDQETIANFDREIERTQEQIRERLSSASNQLLVMSGHKRVEETAKRKEVHDIQISMQDLQQEVARQERKIRQLDKDMENEERRSNRNTESARGQKQTELRGMGDERERLEQECRQVEHEHDNLSHEMRDLQGRRDELRSDHERLSANVHEAQSELQRWQRAEKNTLCIWGQALPEVLNEINRTKWRGVKPIGPIGLHVKIRDRFTNWVTALDVAIGATMKDFIVTDYQDQQHLAHCNVIVVPNLDPIDTQNEEPDRQFLTVKHAIEVTHPGVHNVLVINNRYQQLVLIEDRRQATEVTRRGYPPFVDRVYIPDGFVIGSKRGGLQVTPPSNNNRNPRFQSNTEAQLRRATAHHHEVKDRCNEVRQRLDELDDRIIKCRDRQRELQDSRAQLKRQIQRISNKMDVLQEALNEQEDSVNILAIQEERKIAQNEQRMYKSQLDEAQKQLMDREVELAQLHQELKDLDQRLKSEHSFADNLRNRVFELENKRNRSMKNSSHYVSKKCEYQGHVTADRNLLADMQEQCQRAIQIATEATGKRPDGSKTIEAIEREIKLLRKKQQAVEQQYNVSIEDAAQQYTVASQAYRNAKNTHKQLNLTVTHLKQQVYTRRALLASLTQAIGYKADCSFRSLMARRGFVGKLVFNHSTKQLDVHANVESSDASKDRSIKTFSGGEKSFATVCLLLSLWEAIPSPIRCLDEFDVFMDEVNRMESMKLLMTTALEMNEAQFVLITPLSVANVNISEDVVIIRLPDPEK